MGWKLFRALRWATDGTKPALNKVSALLHALDTDRLWLNTGTGWFGVDTPPVGATYMQFPGKSDPATLWPSSTWSNISSETLLKGRVPRIEGTASSGGANVSAAFGSSQDDQIEMHWHSDYYLDVQNVGASGGTFARNLSGSANTLLSMNPRAKEAVTDGTNPLRSGAATRDASVTVRVWQRTA
jgi:hypothetical protein